MAAPASFNPQPVNASARPGPTPPKFLKHQVYEHTDSFSRVDEHAIMVARYPHRSFRDLMWDLVHCTNFTEIEKVRIIFRWMTSKNMYILQFDNEAPGSPEEVLTAFRRRKGTFAKIFELMCCYAGLQCVTLNGHAKGVDYRPGKKFVGTPYNHSWNAVHIEGSWQLVDAHWATRYLSSEKNLPENLVYEYDDFYFLMEPQQAIYSHFPEDPKWQLLRQPVSLAQFEDLPLAKSQFFKCFMDFFENNHGVVKTKDGRLQMTLCFWKPGTFTYKLAFCDSLDEEYKGVDMKQYIVQETYGNKLNFYIRCPVKSEYYLTIYAQHVPDKLSIETTFRAAAEYKIVADKGCENAQPYPKCSDTNWGPGAPVQQYGLVPTVREGVVHAPNGAAEVGFFKHHNPDVQLLGKLRKPGMSESELDKCVKETEKDNTVSFSVELPNRGEYGLEIYANEPKDGTTYTHMCQYMINYPEKPSDKKPFKDHYDLTPLHTKGPKDSVSLKPYGEYQPGTNSLTSSKLDPPKKAAPPVAPKPKRTSAGLYPVSEELPGPPPEFLQPKHAQDSSQRYLPRKEDPTSYPCLAAQAASGRIPYGDQRSPPGGKGQERGEGQQYRGPGATDEFGRPYAAGAAPYGSTERGPGQQYAGSPGATDEFGRPYAAGAAPYGTTERGPGQRYAGSPGATDEFGRPYGSTERGPGEQYAGAPGATDKYGQPYAAGAAPYGTTERGPGQQYSDRPEATDEFGRPYAAGAVPYGSTERGPGQQYKGGPGATDEYGQPATDRYGNVIGGPGGRDEYNRRPGSGAGSPGYGGEDDIRPTVSIGQHAAAIELDNKPSRADWDTQMSEEQPAPASFQPVRIETKTKAPKPAPAPAEQPAHIENVQRFEKVDNHAIEVSKLEHKNFNDLVWNLIYKRQIDNELDKARAIFLWLCTKDLNEMSFNNVDKDSPEEILMGLKSGKTTYAQIFEILCSYAALHCVIITGYAKGADYKPGMKFSGRQGQHSWNAVLINGIWRLVDCHWAARRLIGKHANVENVRYELDFYYFCPNPAQLIYTHFPEEADWQLLKRPISLGEFEQLAPVKSAFFKYGLELISHRQAVIECNGETKIVISFPPHRERELAFTFSIAFDDGQEEHNGVKLSRYGMHETVGNDAVFRLRFPKSGSYKLLIYAKEVDPDNKDAVYGAVCEYKVDAKLPYGKEFEPYPPCPQTSWGPAEAANRYGVVPLQRSSTIATSDGKIEVKFKMSKQLRFMAKLKSNEKDEKELEKSVMHRIVNEQLALFTLTLPSKGEYGLEIYANDPDKDGNTLFHIWQYLIISEAGSAICGLPNLPPGYLGPQPKFASLGLSTSSHNDPYITTSAGEIQIDMRTTQPLRVTTQLLYSSKGDNDDMSQYVLQQMQGNLLSFLCKFPKAGAYKLQLFALPYTDTSESLPGVYNYVIDTTGQASDDCPYPKQFAQWKEGCYLFTPQDGKLKEAHGKESIPFKIQVPQASAVAIVIGEDWTQLEERSPGIWEENVPMAKHWREQNKVSLCANYGAAKASYSTLLEYTM